MNNIHFDVAATNNIRTIRIRYSSVLNSVKVDII
jgi:hypothetical protein